MEQYLHGFIAKLGFDIKGLDIILGLNPDIIFLYITLVFYAVLKT